jgi:hypothetical protein
MHVAKNIQRIVILLGAVLLLLPSAYAGGGKKRRKNDPDNPNVFDWHDTLNDAEEWAAEEKKPIMVVAYRPGNEEDKKALEKMGSWPSARDHSHKDLAAVKVSADDSEIKALCEKFKVKSLPVVLWMDQHGNVLSMQDFPQVATDLDRVPAGWAALTAKVETFLKDHMDKGQKYAAQSKLREAYREFSMLSQFKGALPQLASDRRKFVAEQWTKLLNVAKSADKKQRAVILKGIEHETAGLDIEKDMHDAIAQVSSSEAANAAPAANAAADQPPAATPPAPVANVTPPPATATPAAPPAPEAPKPVVAEKAPEVKTLGDLANASPVINKQEADDSPMGGVLLGRDAKLKDAYAQLNAGMADYRKATADATDRGPARNALLKSAYEKFTAVMTVIDEAIAAKADAQLDKLEQQISMMMYGCLKYQSL